eukprot:16446576-Heterocapsa_arctica.AAC.1
MFELMKEFKTEIIEFRRGQVKPRSPREGAVRSTLRTSATMEFPKGSEEALLDLDAWLREYDR